MLSEGREKKESDSDDGEDSANKEGEGKKDAFFQFGVIPLFYDREV